MTLSPEECDLITEQAIEHIHAQDEEMARRHEAKLIEEIAPE